MGRGDRGYAVDIEPIFDFHELFRDSRIKKKKEIRVVKSIVARLSNNAEGSSFNIISTRHASSYNKDYKSFIDFISCVWERMNGY